MKRLYKVILAVFVALAGALIIGSAPVLAADSYKGVPCNGAAKSSPVCSAKSSDPLTGKNGAIAKITKLIAIIAGIAAVIIIIISGIRFITAGGDAGSIATARSGIIYAAVGLIVIVLAQAIITFIVSRV